MSYKKKITEALIQAEQDSIADINISPKAVTGCCTISAGGWSEQKHDITESACNKQKGPGVTVTWKEGSC